MRIHITQGGMCYPIPDAAGIICRCCEREFWNSEEGPYHFLIEQVLEPLCEMCRSGQLLCCHSE